MSFTEKFVFDVQHIAEVYLDLDKGNLFQNLLDECVATTLSSYFLPAFYFFF